MFRALSCLLLLAALQPALAGESVLRNASYDPTREFYADYNRMFAAGWRQRGGGDVEVLQTHGGSGAQADAVIAGEPAEALRVLADSQTSQAFEIVYPSISIRAEPVVAVVDRNAEAHDVGALADAYVETLFTHAAQRLVAQHHFRPIQREGVPASQLARFRPLTMVTIEDAFGGWPKAHATHFADGGLYDHILTPPAR